MPPDRRKTKFIPGILVLPFLFLCYWIVGGCTKEVEIELPDQKPEYVVNCLFQPFTLPYPENISVSLSQTAGFLDSSYYPPVSEAEIHFFHSDTLIGKLEYIDSTHTYWYSTYHEFTLKPGSYSLSVKHDDFIITASDILPEKVFPGKFIVDSYAGKDEYNRNFGRVNIVFTDPPDETNYYEISIGSASKGGLKKLYTDFPSITSESYYPSTLNLDHTNPEFLPFSDAAFDGDQLSIPVIYKHGIITPGKNVTPHVISLHFRTISENYYNYRVSTLKQGYMIESDVIYGQSEPLNVHSNINGGYGIFAAYQSVDHSFIIDKDSIYEVEF
ncbi:MAG: DUF4249 domain-containing protein [bacterium]